MDRASILLIESNAELCSKWTSLLSKEGCFVVAAIEPTAASTLLSRQKYSAIFLDARLPQSFIKQAIQYLKKESLSHGTRIFVTSTHTEVVEYQIMAQLPEAIFILKPLTDADLQVLIRDLSISRAG